MRWTFVIAILALTPTCIVLGQEQSTSRDRRSSVEQAIKQLDNERIRAQVLMRWPLTASTLMILSAWNQAAQ
jgi:hypothetical protein